MGKRAAPKSPDPVPFDEALRRLLKAKPHHKPAKKSGEGGSPERDKAKPRNRPADPRRRA